MLRPRHLRLGRACRSGQSSNCRSSRCLSHRGRREARRQGSLQRRVSLPGYRSAAPAAECRLPSRCLPGPSDQEKGCFDRQGCSQRRRCPALRRRRLAKARAVWGARTPPARPQTSSDPGRQRRDQDCLECPSSALAFQEPASFRVATARAAAPRRFRRRRPPFWLSGRPQRRRVQALVAVGAIAKGRRYRWVSQPAGQMAHSRTSAWARERAQQVLARRRR